MREKIAIVGSAPIGSDESLRIDLCDLVVRFNGCKVWGGHSGEKTDVLCLNSGGDPVRKLIVEKTILKSRFYPQVSELWIPRDIRVVHDHMRSRNPFDPGLADNDLSDEIIRSNRLDRVPVVRFSTAFNLRVFELLRRHGAAFSGPSTGFFAIQYALDEPRFADWDKLAFGFAFKGWAGHPFAAEREIVMRYAKDRQDFTFVPC